MGMSFAAATKKLTREDINEDALARLERIILDHNPKSLQEAVAMLDVAIPDLAIGGRSDGRDLNAVIRVRELLVVKAPHVPY